MGFRVPKTNFTINYKGKKMNIVAATHSTPVGDRWGTQALCPWGCGAKFIITGRETPKKVEEEMLRAVKSHYMVSH